MGARLIIIRYCCGKQCARAPLNRFLIRDLHHKLHLLCHLPLSSVIDDKIRPPTSFSTPCRKKNFDPPPRLSTPSPKEKFRPPTSFWTIRTLARAFRITWSRFIWVMSVFRQRELQQSNIAWTIDVASEDFKLYASVDR